MLITLALLQGLLYIPNTSIKNFAFNTTYYNGDFIKQNGAIFKVLQDGASGTHSLYAGEFETLADFTATNPLNNVFAFILNENAIYKMVGNIATIQADKSLLFNPIQQGNLQYQFAGFDYMQGSFKNPSSIDVNQNNFYRFSGQDLYFLDRQLIKSLKTFEGDFSSIKNFIKYHFDYLLATPILANATYKRGQVVYYNDGIYQVVNNGTMDGTITLTGAETLYLVVNQNTLKLRRVATRYGNHSYFFIRYNNFVEYQYPDSHDAYFAILGTLLSKYIAETNDISFLNTNSSIPKTGGFYTYKELLDLSRQANIDTQIANNLTYVFQNATAPDGTSYNIQFKMDTDRVIECLQNLVNVYTNLNDASDINIVNNLITTLTLGDNALYSKKHKAFRVYYGQNLDNELPTYFNNYYPFWHAQITHKLYGVNGITTQSNIESSLNFLNKYTNYWSIPLLTDNIETEGFLENSIYAIQNKGIYTLNDSLIKTQRIATTSLAVNEAFMILELQRQNDLQAKTSSISNGCNDKDICKLKDLSYDALVEFVRPDNWRGNKAQSINVLQEYGHFKTISPISWVNNGTYNNQDGTDASVVIYYNDKTKFIDNNWTFLYNDNIYNIKKRLNVNERNEFLIFYLQLKNTNDN